MSLSVKMSALDCDHLEAILSAYGLTGSRVSALKSSEDLTVRIDTSADASFALRLCGPDTGTSRLDEELAWLTALRRDTDIAVPEVVSNLAGELVTPWPPPPATPKRFGVVFRWLEGEPIARHMAPEAAASVGVVMARLHQHSRDHTPRRLGSFGGAYRFDANWLSGPTSWWQTRASRDLGDDVFARLVPAVEATATVLRERAASSGNVGIIHSDLHFGNVLILGDGRLGVIDFAGLALGDYLLDAAVTELELLDYDDGIAWVETFRNAYAAQIGAPGFLGESVTLLRVAAGLVFLEWLFSAALPAERSEKSKWVPEVVSRMQVAARSIDSRL